MLQWIYHQAKVIKRDIEIGWRSSLSRQTSGEVVATDTDRKKLIEVGWRNSLSRHTAREVVATDVKKATAHVVKR